MRSRAEHLAELSSRTFDALVVGGGITGAGIARDAALRGLSVALVEQGDFASGTSSRSSRLIHGGVRYLEHGHLHLVFEASAERRRLLRLAPHLVHPLAFTWPVYRGQRLPLWKNFIKEGEIIEKGFITLPDRPGIGVEMNEEGARKAQIPGTSWFEA